MMPGALLDLLGLDEGADRPAVIGADGVLSRGELLRRATTRAAEVRACVPLGARVALEDGGDAESVVNVVAALLSGRPLALVPQEHGVDPVQAAAAGCAAVLRTHGVDALDRAAPLPPRLDSRFGEGLTGSPELVVLFTSGTTNEPRGVRLSEANVAANLTAMLRVAPPWGPDARFGMVLALTHSFGLSMVLLSLARRTPIVLLGGGPPSRSVVERFESARVSVLACVPYYLRLLRLRGLELGADLGTALDTLLLAGGGVTDHELSGLVPRFSGSCLVMYGFTEATARVAVRRIGDGAPADSVGLPLPGTHVSIVGPDGRAAPIGSEGRVRVSSPSLMMGYLGDEVRDGTPFTTTDLGRVDAGGNLFVTGREAEMLNFRGNRVSLVAAEAAIVAVAGIADARLVPDDGSEDAQCTLYVVAEAGADPRALRRQALRAASPRGLVREVVLTDRLETTRSGKPLRRRAEAVRS